MVGIAECGYLSGLMPSVSRSFRIALFFKCINHHQHQFILFKSLRPISDKIRRGTDVVNSSFSLDGLVSSKRSRSLPCNHFAIENQHFSIENSIQIIIFSVENHHFSTEIIISRTTRLVLLVGEVVVQHRGLSLESQAISHRHP